MSKKLLSAVLFAGLSVALVACDKPTVNVGAPAVAVPGPAGPAGATGDKGEPGKSSDTTTVIVTPAEPVKN